MALIQCPECGREISDRVTACPQCGYPLSEQNQQSVSPQLAASAGSNASKKTKLVVVYAVAAICIVAVIIFSLIASKTKTRNTYIDDLSKIRESMFSGAADAEDLCILAHDVWYNTIYEEFDSRTDPYTSTDAGFHEDFNDSLAFLYGDETTKSAIFEIEVNRHSVDNLIKKLQNPTDEFSACYDTLDALYDAYCGLTNLATSPSGSLKSFTESYREYDSDFIKYYEKLGNQIPEKK